MPSVSVIDVQKELGTEDACLAYLEAARWPSGVACLNCGSTKVSRVKSTVKDRKTGEVKKTRTLFECLEPQCRYQSTHTTGTIFHDTHLPLTKWFLALAIFLNAKKSLSAYQMQRDLGCHYKTAWHLLHRIREAMDGGGGLLTGKVEVDETHVGGRFDKRRKRGRWETPAVAGLVERATNLKPATVRAQKIQTTSAQILASIVRANVSPKARALYTDQSIAYKRVGREFRHQTVNHIKLEWVRGDVHTNTIEGFWSLFKRGLRGSWHHVSAKHLERYLSEFSYRYNNRQAEDLFGLTVRRLANGQAWPYAELASDPERAS